MAAARLGVGPIAGTAPLLEPLDTDGPIPEHVVEAFGPVIFGAEALE